MLDFKNNSQNVKIVKIYFYIGRVKPDWIQLMKILIFAAYFCITLPFFIQIFIIKCIVFVCKIIISKNNNRIYLLNASTKIK